MIKGAQSDFLDLSLFIYFFPKLLEILISEEGSFFLITHGKFHSWKVFNFLDIAKNMPTYGSYN